MTTFSYQAVNREGKQVRGELAASDRGRAHAQLVAQGLQPFLLEAGKEGSASSRSETKKERAAPASGKRGGTLRLSDKERLAFTEELCDLLTAGLTLEQALRSMEKREGKAGRKPIAGTVRTKVEEGMTLAQSLRQTSASFGDLYCNLVLAGEQSASLGIILQRQRRYLQTIQELRSRISSSMIYPAFLLISSLGVTVIFITFLIPKLTTLMEATDSTPPLPAIVLMAASDFLRAYGLLLAGGMVLMGSLFLTWTKLPGNRTAWDHIKLRIPLLRRVLLAGFHVRFLETLSTIMGSGGLPLVKALELAEGATENTVLQQKLVHVRESVADGSSLARALDRSGIFPSLLSDLVQVGEQTGRLPEALARAAERFDKELTKAIGRVSLMIQPTTIIFMALLVGSMAYIMISVIYDTISLLRR